MVAEFGFTQEEAARHTTSARSYCASPIFVGSKVVGVLYLYSTEPQVFPFSLDANVLESAAKTLSSYLKSARYVL
jgi:GAF domain-containing protein